MSNTEQILTIFLVTSYILIFIVGYAFERYIKALSGYFLCVEKALKDLETRLTNLEKQSDEK